MRAFYIAHHHLTKTLIGTLVCLMTTTEINMKPWLIGVSLLCVASSASAQEQTLTTYTTLTAPEYVDAGVKGMSVGDMYVRRGDVALSADGPVVGQYYSQATIVFLNEASQESARSFFKEIILPEGSIYKMDFVQTKSGKPADGKHTHDGAIIGGTGAYAGIRGTYTLEIAPSGKDAKTVLTYWIGQ